MALGMNYDAELDATGLLCPLPVLKARKRLKSLKKGHVLKMLADDPAAIVDVPHFCAEQGHELLKQDVEGDAQVYFLQKA
jgi:tRNA 2-thiouridine synthesizing protein A